MAVRSPPGQFFVLVRNPARFAEKYPAVPIGGTYGGQLDNGGETLRLVQPSGGVLWSITYDDSRAMAGNSGWSRLLPGPGRIECQPGTGRCQQLAQQFRSGRFAGCQ
jgi:hypothetical protein